jgi:hypothetical protein
LLDRFYGGTSIIAGATLLGDNIIEKLTTCGERVETREEFVQHARWPLGFDGEGTGATTEYGILLLKRLKMIYSKFDDDTTADEAHLAHLQSLPTHVDTGSFYGGLPNHTQSWTNLTPESYLQHNVAGTSTEIANKTIVNETGRGTSSRGIANTTVVTRGACGRQGGRGTHGRGCGASQVS